MTTTGAFVPDTASAEQLRARGSLKWTGTSADIGAWVAESDHGTAPAVLSALEGVVRDGLLGYLPDWVRQDMAAACAEWHERRYGWTVPPERIHPVADVREALRLTLDHFAPPGSPVIVPVPNYMPFLTAPQTWGHPVLPVPMVPVDGHLTIDLAALDAAFRAGGHVLVLTTPHNPTGTVMTRAEGLALGAVVARHGGRVFADEVHAPLTLPGASHVPYASLSPVTAAHTLTATSASKAWNIPGLKCAQVLLSNDADAATWEPLDAMLTHGAATAGVVANAAAYRSGGEWLDGLLDHLDGNRRLLAHELAENAPLVGHLPPEGTYLAWLDLRALGSGTAGSAGPAGAATGVGTDLAVDLAATGGDVASPARLLLERHGLAVVDGAACGAPGFVRLNLAMPRPLVREAARRVAAFARGAADR